MTGGFAAIAWPAKYGNSGVMTFVVNQRGIVFEKDLGARDGHGGGGHPELRSRLDLGGHRETPSKARKRPKASVESELASEGVEETKPAGEG